MSLENMDQSEKLIRTIANSWLLIRQKAKRLLVEMSSDLTFEQLMILHLLDQEEGQNLGKIAEKADRERTTISRMIAGLEKRNLVVAIVNKEDKRQKLLYLTNLGKERLAMVSTRGEQFYGTVYRGLDNDQIDSCYRALQKIITNLEKV